MLYHIKLTAETLKACAEWAHAGKDAAAVEMLVDDTMLLAEQGDDRGAWDTDGSPGSEEYLSLAPLDPEPVVAVSALAEAIGLPEADENGILPGSAADQIAAVYELLGNFGVVVA